MPYLSKTKCPRRRVPCSPVALRVERVTIESSQSSHIGFSCISASRVVTIESSRSNLRVILISSVFLHARRVSRLNRVVAVESSSRIDFICVSACTSSQSSQSSRHRVVLISSVFLHARRASRVVAVEPSSRIHSACSHVRSPRPLAPPPVDPVVAPLQWSCLLNAEPIEKRLRSCGPVVLWPSSDSGLMESAAHSPFVTF